MDRTEHFLLERKYSTKKSWISLLLVTCVILINLASTQVHATQEVPQSFSIDGRAYSDSNATIPLLDTISTQFQILNAAQDCILYAETQSLITTSSNGYFTAQVGSATGAGKRSALDSANAMSTVFANSGGAISGKKVSDGTACSYTPTNGDNRYIRILMTPAGDSITRTLSPNASLDAVPFALQAERSENLQGYTPANFLQVNTTGANSLTQANLESVFTSTNYSKLTNSITGSYPQNNIGTTSTDGLALSNTTASTAVTQQNSPALHFQGSNWDTTNTASKSIDVKFEAVGSSGNASSSNSVFNMDMSINGGAYSHIMSFDQYGNLTVPGTIQNYSSAGFRANYGPFTSYGQSLATTPRDGLVAASSTNATAGAPEQMSPRLRFLSNGWDTGSLSNISSSWSLESIPTSGNPEVDTLRFGNSYNGGAYSYPLALTNNGNIGVGTTTPVDNLSFGNAPTASTTKALVNLSNTALSSADANGTYIGANPAAFSGNFLDFQINGTYKFRVDYSGSITTRGNYNMPGNISVYHSSTGTTSNDAIRAYSTDTASAGYTVGMSPRIRLGGVGWDSGASASKAFWGSLELMPVTGNPATSYLRFGMDPGTGTYSYPMALTSDGRLGLGTTSPTNVFEINSAYGAGQDYLKIAGSGHTALTINQWQQVTIGDTTAGAKLKVYNNAGVGALAGQFVSSDLTNANGVYIQTGSNSSSNFGLKVMGNAGARTDFFVEADGKVGIGNAAPSYALDVTGDINATGCVIGSAGTIGGVCTSDERLKTDVHSFDLGLKALLGITPHYFKYNGLGGHPVSQHFELGVIAQEVEQSAPELIVTKDIKLHPDDNENTTIKQVNYSAFIYVVINSIKELYYKWQQDSDSIHRNISSIELENQSLKIEVENLKMQNQNLLNDNQEIKERLEKIEKSLSP